MSFIFFRICEYESLKPGEQDLQIFVRLGVLGRLSEADWYPPCNIVQIVKYVSCTTHAPSS